VTAIHKIGIFALLTKKDSSDLKVYFREKEKGTWPWDVPGGKVALGDVSHSDTVARELFEELGMIVYDGRLSHIIAAKYDPKSAKEGVPVIALYCHYELANAEASYIEKILPDGADGQKLVAHSVREVIREKHDRRQSWEKGTGKDQYEAVCHAPLEALLAVAERSKIPIGKTRAAAAGKARR
jgi:8-oxo-dGTP pyrophosphatase MutT (NUDIX family)